jgi:hypothetical protein
MPDYEARIRTKFGELVIHFNDRGELDKRFESAPELVQAIETKSSSFAIIQEQPLPGLEGICTVTPEGLPRILVYPDSGSDKIRLALYASSRALTTDEIIQVTGVEDPTAYRVMKFDEVIESGGKYSLASKGRSIVSAKLIPKLRKKLESAIP